MCRSRSGPSSTTTADLNLHQVQKGAAICGAFFFSFEKKSVSSFSQENVPENAIAVALILPDLTRSVAEEHLSELERLIETAGGTVVERVFAKRPRPDPATYVGSGKAEQLKSLAADNGANLIVFDDDLSPAQTRSLEKITEIK